MEDCREDLVESRTVFQGRLLSVAVDTVRLPDGRTATRDVVKHPGAVALVPLLGDNVVLVRQWRHAIGAATLEIPAGTLTPGEPPEVCAARELAEEAGYRPGRLDLLASVGLAPGYSSEIIHIYLAEDLQPAQGRQDEDERVAAEPLPLAEAARRCLAGEIVDAKTVVGVLLALHRRCGSPFGRWAP
jgi:ADP-ribose pyrophosphatase